MDGPKLPLCGVNGCRLVTGHVAPEHTTDVEYRQIKMHPWAEVERNFVKQAEEGHFVLQSWTCIHCGAVQRMSQVNGFFNIGGCENCGGDTDLKKHGCNFTLLAVVGPHKPELRRFLQESGFMPPKDTDA